jgi:hypothetical protein
MKSVAIVPVRSREVAVCEFGESKGLPFLHPKGYLRRMVKPKKQDAQSLEQTRCTRPIVQKALAETINTQKRWFIFLITHASSFIISQRRYR